MLFWGSGILSIALIIGYVGQLDWQLLTMQINIVVFWPVFSAAALFAVSIFIRSLRWRLIAGLPRGLGLTFWQATSLGYLANMIYPARAGEFIRMGFIHHNASISLGRAVAGIFLDRIMDGLVLAGLLLLVLVQARDLPLDVHAGLGIVILFFLLSAILAIIAIKGQQLFPLLLKPLQQLPPRLAERSAVFMQKMIESIQLLRNPGTLLTALGLTALVNIIDISALWVLMRAFSWPLPWQTAMLLGVFIMFGSMLPALPGYIGVYQIACVMALHRYGISEEGALVYSLILQMALLAVFLLQSGIVVMQKGIGVLDLTKRQLSRESAL